MVTTKKDLISYSKIKRGYPAEATIPTLFYDRAKKFENKKLFSFLANDTFQTLSWSDVSNLVQNYIHLFRLMGINKGSKVAVLSENSPETVAILVAAMSIGSICCPIHNNKSPDQISRLINDYKYDILVISALYYQKFEEHLKKNHKSLRCFTINGFDDCVKRKGFGTSDKSYVIDVKPDDTSYIMLSSGTTGSGNGICLTHDNILSNIRQVLTILTMLSEEDKFFGTLPFSHSYGGLAELYQLLYLGAEYHFCRANGFENMLNEMKLAKPTVFQSVPRVWEKMHNYFTNSKLGYLNVIDELGGNIKFGFSAGAFLNLDISKYFFYQGLPIYQGYGLTEASPSIAISKPEDPFILNTYEILPEIELTFSEDSEILVKGPNVLKSFYFEPQNVLRDGLLHTGDLAISPRNGYISIIGRIKDVIVLSTAYKVVPDAIEEMITKHPLIKYAVLIGNDRPFVSCLIFLQTDSSSLSKEFLSNKDPEYIEIENHIAKINQQLSSNEHIKKFIIFSSDIEEIEITVSHKIIRETVEQNRKELIDQLYE